MILFSIFMYIILKGTVADQNDTNIYSGIQLWRVQGNLDEDVIDEFYERGAVEKDSFTWLAYPYLNDINRYLVKVASAYKYAKVTSIGWTFKNNPISMLKISNNNPDNDAILIDGGIHGHEYTAVISVLYFIDSIVKDLYSQPDYIQNKDWYIIPVLNPDGYEFSLDFDPLWRKNRRKFSDYCLGVELNRNFDYNWSLTGSTQDKCDKFYSGPDSFSEEETKAFKKLVDRVQFKAYLSIHSAGTQVLYPRNIGQRRSDDDEIIQIAKDMAVAMSNVSNIKYRHGCVEKGFEVSAGNSMEWMYHKKDVKYSYLIEARSADANDLQKRKEIETVGKEVKAAVLRLAELIYKKNTTENLPTNMNYY